MIGNLNLQQITSDEAKEIDSVLFRLSELVGSSKMCNQYIIAPSKMKEFAELFVVCKKLMSAQQVKASYELNTPFPYMGTISLVGQSIDLIDKEFVKYITTHSSNWEVHPRTDGKIQMDIVLYGVAELVGDSNV